jgi:hypothetical protein
MVAIQILARCIAGGEPGSLVGLSWVGHETIGLHSPCDRSRDGFGPMRRLLLHASRADHVPAGARPGLRSGHPLVRASEAVRYTIRQWIYVAAVLVGSGIAVIEGHCGRRPMACSAGAVLLILSALLAAHLQSERDCAIELIMEGREKVPIAAIQRSVGGSCRGERARASSPVLRTSLKRFQPAGACNGVRFRFCSSRGLSERLRMICVASSTCCGPKEYLRGGSPEPSGWSSTRSRPLRP